MKRKLISVIFFTITVIVNCQTSIPGGTVSGSWTSGGSPYLIEGSIMIPDGSTLTIQPGVTVNFQGHYKFLVSGRLLAIGNITDSIFFTAVNTSTGWYGIRFDNTSSSNDTSKLKYCSIRYGNATSALYPDNSGGGILFRNFSKALVENCLFKNNSAVCSGGGIFCTENSNPAILNNTFKSNMATYLPSTINGGGGIGCASSSPLISGNIFMNNSASSDVGGGGGIFCYTGQPIISNNLIINNSASNIGSGPQSNGGGGGIFCCAQAIVFNNTISNNSVTGFTGGGGGLYCFYADNAKIYNNTVTNNSVISSFGNGGGIYCSGGTPLITNNTISNNSTLGNGGALYCTDSSKPTFINCIFYGNTASLNGTQVFLNDEPSDPNFYYCDVQSGSASFGLNGNFFTGIYQNNIDSDPIFVSASSGSGTGFDGFSADWELQKTSSCINTGNPTGIYPALDKAGNPRIFGNLIDIGAYEYVDFRLQDSLALVALYNSTGGTNWTNKTNWLSSEPISTWHGITVVNNRVTSLNLGGNNLTGSIPLEIGNLTNLNDIYLFGNLITGSIPIEIGNLMNLKNLTLNSNQLTGSIPKEIGKLANLIYLTLFSNQLTGSIPTEIGNLTNLKALHLEFNQITGTIPKEICNLTNLERLYLSSPQLTGAIPQEVGNMANLKQLYLFNSKLNGSIPKEIGNLTNLQQLNLNNNLFTGSIPKEIGNLTSLTDLRLESNQFIGSIPTEINNLINLNILYIVNNKFDVLPTLTLNVLNNLRLENNRFTFEDIEPNINVPKISFAFSPQDSIGVMSSLTLNMGEDYTFTVTCGGSDNQYQWYKDGTSILSATNSSYSISNLQLTDAGSYHCAINNTVVTNLTIYSRPIKLTISVPTILEDSKEYTIKIYPNPVKNVLYITGQIENTSALIYNLKGNLLYTETIYDSKFDASHIPTGIYLLILKNSKGTYTYRFIKQ